MRNPSTVRPCLAFGLLGAVFLTTRATAHVLLVDPAPRVINDYLYSFDGEGPDVCDPRSESCNQFCGHPRDDPESPLTELPVGVPFPVQWVTNVPHPPYMYRLSLNKAGDGDNHFDDQENFLAVVSNADAANPDNVGLTGSFSTEVTIPEEWMEHCSDATDPCTLQLWDLYYFVSCANVVLVPGEDTIMMANTTTAGNLTMVYNETELDSTENGLSPSITLMDGSGEPNGRGFCPDIGGEPGKLNCSIVSAASCKPEGLDTQFAYSDSRETPRIFSWNYGGDTSTGWSAGVTFWDTTTCSDLGPPPEGVPGCLYATDFAVGSPVRLSLCIASWKRQKFIYTTSGKFKLEHRDEPGTFFCLGAGDTISQNGDRYERDLILMDCDLADESLITWKVEPPPVYMMDDGPMIPMMDMEVTKGASGAIGVDDNDGI